MIEMLLFALKSVNRFTCCTCRCFSLRSWRYSNCTRNKVLAAEPKLYFANIRRSFDIWHFDTRNGFFFQVGGMRFFKQCLQVLPPSPLHSGIPLAADPPCRPSLFRSSSLTESLEQSRVGIICVAYSRTSAKTQWRCDVGLRLGEYSPMFTSPSTYNCEIYRGY